MAIESINPATGALLRSFQPFTEDAVRQKIALADEAFHAYATVPLGHRALWMRKLASLLEQETEDLATLDYAGDGKADLRGAAGGVEVRHLLPLLRRKRRSHPGSRGRRYGARTTAMCAGTRWGSYWR